MDRARRERLIQNAPQLLLGAAIVVAFALVLRLSWHLTFFADSFDFLMNRRHLTADAIFDPHNEHIVVIPVLITWLFLQIFGMTSALPEFILLGIGLVVTAWLLYVYLERRVNQWLAVFGACLILFLGPAYEVLLWTFEISYVGSMLFGLLMILALERGDRRGDLIACVSLICCFGFSSLGIAFAIAAAVAILVGPRDTWRERAFSVVVPVVLYALWWIGWGHNAETHFGAHNLLASPRFVVEAAAVALGSLFGLGADPSTGIAEPVWGRALLIALVGIFGYRIYKKGGVDRAIWPVAAAAISNWFLTAFNEIPGREPVASRYQYISCIFILMILANLLKGVEWRRKFLIVAAGVTICAVAVNIVVLKHGKDNFYEQAVYTRADTAALEISRPRVDPEFELTPEISGTGALVNIYAEDWFPAVEEFGSMAYTEDELATAPEIGRRSADVILASALKIEGVIREGGPLLGGVGSCAEIGGPNGAGEVALHVGLNRIVVPAGTEATPSLRRFAETPEFPVPLATIPSSSTMLLRIPSDESPRPWLLHIDSGHPVRVCG
jgi:hypothetical protein